MNGLLHGGGFKLVAIGTMGTIAAVIFMVTAMTIIFKLIDKIVEVRFSKEEELKGLDISLYDMEVCYGFQIFNTK